MKIKRKKLFTKGILTAMSLLFIWACTSPEPIEKQITNENVAQPKEVGIVKQWITNTTTNDATISNVYALHQWDLAKAAIINKSEPDNFTLDIPLSVSVTNSNYNVFARYIQLTNELKIRVFVKSKDIIKNNIINTNFVYPIENADDFLKIPELANTKLINHKFKDFHNNDLALKNSGCGCNSGLWSNIWNAIANFGGGIWNGIRGVSNTIGSFFSNWGGSYSNYTTGGTGGGYGLYEFEEILAGNEVTGGGYQGWVQQELFYLPNTVSNGEMYHMREYGKAVSNIDVITEQITSAYPSVNEGELLNAIFKLHLHSNYHNDIYNGNLANVISIVNFEDYVYDEQMWDLLQKFTHKFFYENSSRTNLLSQALDNTSNYKKIILLTALGFKANYVINTFSQQQLDWMANNPETGKQIAQFLNQNSTGYGYNNEVVIIILEATNNLMSFTPSDYPGMNDGIPFSWWNDEDFIINSGNFDIDDEQPNAKEVALFALYPTEAALHIENSIKALSRAEELVADGSLTGIGDGKADAFRHAYWNALGTAEFGTGKMKLFADAHEWGESGLSVTMDFHNNHHGRIIGSSFDFFNSASDIEAAVLAALYTGTLKYINSSGFLIPTNI